MFWFIVAFVVAFVIAYAATPKSTQQAATLGTVNGTTAEEGKPIVVIFGTLWLQGNVVWYGDVSTEPVSSDSGKK